MGSFEYQPQPLATQPGDGDVRLIAFSGDQQWIVGTLLEPHHDLLVRDLHAGRSVDEVAEQMPRLGDLVLSHSAAISSGLWARFWNLTTTSSSAISTPAEASMKSRNRCRDLAIS